MWQWQVKLSHLTQNGWKNTILKLSLFSCRLQKCFLPNVTGGLAQVWLNYLLYPPFQYFDNTWHFANCFPMVNLKIVSFNFIWYILNTNNIYHLQQYHGNIIPDLVLKPMHSILRDIYIKHDKIQPELGEYQNVCINYTNLSSIKLFFIFDFLKER